MVGPLLLLLGGCAGGPSPTAPAPPAAPLPLSAASSSSSPSPQPDEQEPADAVPQVRATLPPVTERPPAPQRFTARSIGVELPVVPAGIGEDGQLELPGTVREVSWYAYGVRPGDPAGTTVLAAHVDTKAEGLGPFARLRELRRGDELQVRDVEGRSRRFTVTDVDDVQKSELALDRLFRRDGPPALAVLTCGGPYSRTTGYRDNVVVSARLTEPR